MKRVKYEAHKAKGNNSKLNTKTSQQERCIIISNERKVDRSNTPIVISKDTVQTLLPEVQQM